MIRMLEWIQSYSHSLALLAMAAAVAFVISLPLIPWVLLQLPADCFMLTRHAGSAKRRKISLLRRLVWRLIRNALGYTLMGFGFVMLFLPGQGILTILAGGAIARFPYKKRLLRWLLSQQIVRHSLNKLRRRYGREPFQFPD